MMGEIAIDGKNCISSKQAGELTGYAQDYIGQLARAGLIEAHRIGGLWYIVLASLQRYKAENETYKPQQPELKRVNEMESTVMLDGKDFISASRASKLTGYHKHYVGQLARSGKIVSRQIGNRWYVDRAGLIAHKKEKDALLAAVQVQAVGLSDTSLRAHDALEAVMNEAEPLYTYTSESSDLMPILKEKDTPRTETRAETDTVDERSIPIRTEAPRVNHAYLRLTIRPDITLRTVAHYERAAERVTSYGLPLAIGLLTIVIIISFGLVAFKANPFYTFNSETFPGRSTQRSMMAAAANMLGRAGDFLEVFLAPELIYRR